MGLFGGNIQFESPTAQFRQAGDIFEEALGFGRKEFPLALGARETGLQRVGAGELEPTQAFFESFQPTSFEKGISGTFFQDALERAKRTAGQRASLAGIESVFPEQFSRAISPTLFNIGQFLANQGQRRGELALQGRQQGILQQLSIDPLQAIQPFTNLSERQSNLQSQADFQTAMQNAISEFQKRASGADLFKQIGQVGGGILGAAFGGPAGGAVASQIGGGIGDLFGPNVEDISRFTGQAKQAEGGFDLNSLIELFSGGQSGKAKKVDLSSQFPIPPNPFG